MKIRWVEREVSSEIFRRKRWRRQAVAMVPQFKPLLVMPIANITDHFLVWLLHSPSSFLDSA